MDELLRTLAALMVVLGLLGGLWWGLRRFTNLTPDMGGQNDLKVMSWRPLDGRRKLAVIRWGDREHLVLTSPAGDLNIAERPAKELPNEGDAK